MADHVRALDTVCVGGVFKLLPEVDHVRGSKLHLTLPLASAGPLGGRTGERSIDLALTDRP